MMDQLVFKVQPELKVVKDHKVRKDHLEIEAALAHKVQLDLRAFQVQQ